MKENVSYRDISEQNSKRLADVFKELEEFKRSNQENIYDDFDGFDQDEDVKEEIVIDSSCIQKNKKIKRIIAIDLIIMYLIPFGVFANYIFAFTNEIPDMEQIEASAAVDFEANSEALAMEEILLENVSVQKTKELVEENREIEFEIQYVEDQNLPLEEEVVAQEGENGSKDVTLIKTLENEDVVEEKLIEEDILEKPVTKIIRVGTSEFLKEKQVHIDDTLYVTSDIDLKEKNSDSSESLALIPSSIEVELKEMNEEWCKVKYDDYEGYIKSESLTSSKANPEIIEANRIQKLKLSLDINMPLNQSSGLTLDDFKRVLSNDASDRYDVFSSAAEDFYNIDRTYNVNGIFLASIGIHESAWGSSRIARDKNNLFGFGAYDSSPYESALAFDTYYSGIEKLAQTMVRCYLNPAGTPIYDDEVANGAYYNGNTVADVNVRYASDPDWHTKVYKYMARLYGKL